MATNTTSVILGAGRIAILSLSLVTCCACSSSMRRGVRAYDSGHYVTAMDSLREAERGVSDDDRPRYALYRGLAHLALGDTNSAEVWLAEAKARTDADRECLDRRDRGRLLAAWATLGHEPGTWGATVLRRHGM